VQVTDATDIRFDGWELRTRSGELVRAGNVQRLPQQPLRVLVELLAHPGEVVTRERLVQVLWPKGVVDFDNSLNAVVRKLRAVLGDDSETPRYIETLPRIGYRFVGKIETVAALEPVARVGAGGPAIRWQLAGLLLFFGVVIAMTLFLRRDRMPHPTAATSARTGANTPPRRTTNERAYDLYLQGIFNRSRRDIYGNQLAIENFEAALKLDPYYADAWAGLAETESGDAMTMQSPVVPTYERARSAALRAIELDDGLGHGHAALAHIYMAFDRDFAKAEAELDLARQLDPAYGRVWHTLALLRAFQGRMPEAMDAMGSARQLEPMTLLYSTNYALLLYEARRYDEAIAQTKLLLSSQPRLDQARTILIRSLVAKGDIEAALAQLPLRVDERPTVSDAGLVYAHAGRADEARAEIERIERIGKEGYGVAYDVAVIEAALGNLPAACSALKRAVDDHSLRLLYMRHDTAMDPLRGEACFKDVARKLYGT
jgi:DNA-binding winged helix-turn-helix (wHTH) protein/tetratricopeptide (TPR) repeat protein